MALHKDEAIVLFKRAYGESDRIIRLFTLGSGKIAAIAKGANRSKRRFANTLETFNHIRVEYFDKHEKGMVRIENADIVETNNGIEASLRRASTAGFFTEFADKLTRERERNALLFSTLKEVLGAVKEREFPYSHILYYKLRMLGALGYMPNFTACVYCGKDVPDEMKLHFSYERGGLLCPACTRSLPHRAFSAGTIPGLTSLADNRYGPVPEGEDPGALPEGPLGADRRRFEAEACEIMEGFISFHLDVEFKSYRILKSLLW